MFEAPKFKRLFISDITDRSSCSPRVLHAASRMTMGIDDEDFVQLMDEVKDGLQYVFQTKNTLTFAPSITGRAAMEMVLFNLVEPHDIVLIAVKGTLGTRALSIVSTYKAVAYQIIPSNGDIYTCNEIEEAIIKFKPTILVIVHGDHLSGAIQPLEAIGNLCKEYKCLFVVDTVDSLGAVPVLTDKWNIDAVFSAANTNIGSIDGVAPMSFSSNAETKMLSRKTQIPAFYWEFKMLASHWGCFGIERSYHHTITGCVVYSLREALAEICEEGLENTWRRFRKCGEIFRNGLRENGYNIIGDSTNTLPTIVRAALVKSNRKNTINDFENYVLHVTKEEEGGKEINRFEIIGYNARIKFIESMLHLLN